MLQERPARFIHHAIGLSGAQRQAAQRGAQAVAQGEHLRLITKFVEARAVAAGQAQAAGHQALQDLAAVQVTEVAHIDMGHECGRGLIGQLPQARAIGFRSRPQRHFHAPAGPVQGGQVSGQRGLAAQRVGLQAQHGSTSRLAQQAVFQRRVDRMQVAQHGAVAGPRQPAGQQRSHRTRAFGLRVQVACAQAQAFGQ